MERDITWFTIPSSPPPPFSNANGQRPGTSRSHSSYSPPSLPLSHSSTSSSPRITTAGRTLPGTRPHRQSSVSFAHSTHFHPHPTIAVEVGAGVGIVTPQPPRIVEPSNATSYPRRRVSMSIAPHSLGAGASDGSRPDGDFDTNPLRPPRPYAQPRRRARTMSLSLSNRHPPAEGASKTRKAVIVFLVLLSLFLVGTVVVLSTVSYYFALPQVAFLTEEEVPWRPQDGIRPLKDLPIALVKPSGGVARRQDDLGILGEETLPEVWEDLEEIAEEEEASAFSSDAWGLDGEGTGGYWMRNDWDGTVRGSDSWERLFNVTTRPGETIPRLIHQTWKTDHLPEKWRKAWKECREGMPDYEYMLWTDDLSRQFIAEYYPSYLSMYDSYKYPIQRADSIRYFVLHHFGGVYMDLDIGCRRRLDLLLQGDWEVVLPITKPVGVSNDLIFSSKGSAFMDDTIHGLPAFNHEWFTNYPTVMFSTGPMFLSAQYSIYSSAHPLTETRPRADVRILPKSLYGKNAPTASVPHSFFSHFYGSSWHSDDAGFITFLGAWGKKLMYVASVVIVIGAARLVYIRLTSAKRGDYQLLPSLLISSISGTPVESGSPTSPSSTSTDNEGLPSEIASVFRRAGHLILTAPATLLSRSGRRRTTGLMYFVPAMFQPQPQTPRRPRTASEASQLPLRVRRGPRASHEVDLAPPPYDQSSSISRSPSAISRPAVVPEKIENKEGMEEVDAFLRDAEGSEAGSSIGAVEVGEPEWAEWDGARSGERERQ